MSFRLKKGGNSNMTHKKKNQDKIIAGFLALITAFSPIASVVPVYAADLNSDSSSSVTMDPNSITIDEAGSGGIVLDGSDESSDGITVVDDNNNGESGDGISIGDNEEGGDGIQIDGTDVDGIDIDDIKPNDGDGIDIDKSDGISIDSTSNDDISIDSGSDDGINIEHTNDDSIIIDSINPWDGVSEIEMENEFLSNFNNLVDAPSIYELDIDVRNVHGCVMLSPVDSDDLEKQRIVRVSYSDQDENYITIVTDGDGKQVYQAVLNDIGGIAWSEFVSSGSKYTIKAIADDGYVVSNYSVLEQSQPVITNFVENKFSSYSWSVLLDHDHNFIIDFANVDDISFIENTYDVSDDLFNASDLASIDSKLLSDDSDENNSDEEVESVLLESEVGQLGSDEIVTLYSMTDDVTEPELDDSDVKDAIADPIYESYIRDNLDSKYVNYDHMAIASGIMVKQTFFDKDKLDGRSSIDQIMDSKDVDIVMISQMATLIPVYDVDTSSDYFVTYIDTMHNDSRSYVLDYCFARNNLYGESLNDCVYDYDTGIAYIPKAYFLDSDGKLLLDEIQVQIGQVIDYSCPQYVESVVLDGMSDDVSVNAFQIFYEQCDIQIESGLDINNMEIYINGLPFDKSLCIYDMSTGVLKIAMSSALISSVYVKDTRTVVSKVINAIIPPSIAKAIVALETISIQDMKKIGEVSLDCNYSDINIGDSYNGTGTYYYGSKENLAHYGFVSGYSENYFAYYLKNQNTWFDWIKNGGDRPSLDDIRTPNPEILNFHVDVDSLVLKGSPFEFDTIMSGKNKVLLDVDCCHVNQSAANTIKWGTGLKWREHPNFFKFNDKIWTRVVAKYKDPDNPKKKFIILAFCTKEVCDQTGLGVLKFRVTDTEGEPRYIRLRKVINPRYTNMQTKDLDPYEISGTIFGLYKSKTQAEKAPVCDSPDFDMSMLDEPGHNGLVCYLSTKDEDGLTGKHCITDDDGNLLYDELWVVEVKAGVGYRLPDGDARIHKIDLRDAPDGKVFEVEYKNNPIRDPMGFTLFKVDSLAGNVNCVKDLNIKEDMDGARYRLEYWDVTPEKINSSYATSVLHTVFGTEIATDIDGFKDTVTLKKEPSATVEMKAGYYTLPVGDVHADGSPDCAPGTITSHGVISLNIPECIVSGEWPYMAEASEAGKEVPVLPIGIYRLTEIEPPSGYKLPEGTYTLSDEFGDLEVPLTMSFGVCRQYYNKDLENFGGSFQWVPELCQGASKAPFSLQLDGGMNVKTNIFEENPRYVNIGTLKIDKSTGKPGKPDNNALSLAGIEFGVWLDEDNDGPINHPFLKDSDGKPLQVNPGKQIEGVTLVTDENGCADTVGLNMKDHKDYGVLTPGNKYIIKETKSNGSFFLDDSEFSFTIPDDPEGVKKLYPDDGTPACFFPTLDGDVQADKEITSAKDAFDDYSKNKDNSTAWKLEYTKFMLFQNTPPNIGVGVQKFDLMLDETELGANNTDTHGNADLSGHTFIVINGTKSDIRMNDLKKADGKGTRVNSIWDHVDTGDLKNPYNPTYDELFSIAVDHNYDKDTNTWFVEPDAHPGVTYGDEDKDKLHSESDEKDKSVDNKRGYVCAVLVTDETGHAETPPDLLPMGVYWVIEVDTKIDTEHGGYHDYLVNKLDVGHVGEYLPGEGDDGEDGYKLADGGDEVKSSDIPKDGKVFDAEFTQKLKDTEWKSDEKKHSDLLQAANIPPRGGVKFQKFDLDADDNVATGDSDLKNAEFNI